jgi:hypothetical protein
MILQRDRKKALERLYLHRLLVLKGWSATVVPHVSAGTSDTRPESLM